MKTIPWNLNETEQVSLLRTLRFHYNKWDVYACGRCLVLPEALVLTREEHREVVSISERFADILRRLESTLMTRPDVLHKLGIPPAVIPFLTHAQPTDLQLARYDLFKTPDGGWQVAEFNEDVPGGFNEAVGLAELMRAHVTDAVFTGDLRQALIDAFKPYPCVAFLYATGYSEDLQHMRIVQQWLESAGHETLMASPVHLRCGWRGTRVFGRRIDAAVRFYPGEWFGWLDNGKDWMRALPTLPIMNPLRRLLRQTKRLYAFWHDPSLLPPEDLLFLKQYAPKTLPYEHPDTATSSNTTHRMRWVLKHAFGRMGDAVVMGNLASDPEWTAARAEADQKPHDWLLQERFDVAPLPNRAGPLYPSVGAYLVNHRFAGYYSRAAHQPFINHEAYHVATVVETA